MSRVFMPQTEKSVMEKKLVGVHIDKQDANRIALLALGKGTPRTKILKKVLYRYLDELPTLQEMIDEAAEKAVAAWKQKGLKPKIEFVLFCNEIREDLSCHRLEKELIDEIIKKIGESV